MMLSIGFVSAGAEFRSSLSRSEREAALRPVEMKVPDEEPVLRDDLSDQYGGLCDFALKRVINRNHVALLTLRVESGYGYAEHHKGWLRLGAEFVVEESEYEKAYSFLSDPSVAGRLDAGLVKVSEEFVAKHLPADLFAQVSCSFYILQKPEQRG